MEFLQLKNKNIVCSFDNDNTLKIIKINKNEYDDIQIIKNAHKNDINKIIELSNENIITFSWDYSFKIWKLNNNNEYEIIDEFKDCNKLSSGLEIKENEIILYTLDTNPQSLVFYNLNKKEKIKTLKNLNLSINCLNKIIILNDNEVAVAGNKKVYLIDINNYLILNEINCHSLNHCILKISNNLFLIGDENGTINQYKIENKKLKKESSKSKIHEKGIFSITLLNDMIFTGGNINIKIWKK